MRSTGEVMGIDSSFDIAFAKSQIASGQAMPTSGTVFISVRDEDKVAIIPIAKQFQDLGFEITATGGTFEALSKAGIDAHRIHKLNEGRPNIIDLIKNKQVSILINTPTKKGPQTDEGKIRAMSVVHKVPIVTTLTGATATARAIAAMQKGDWNVRPLQDYFAMKK
jgi:carbamoyl-phosphate synthase large subunit